jgi:predicted NAD-dependent protein-ADP-ribosyltransferase YbiA (DUF1768 family)
MNKLQELTNIVRTRIHGEGWVGKTDNPLTLREIFLATTNTKHVEVKAFKNYFLG